MMLGRFPFPRSVSKFLVKNLYELKISRATSSSPVGLFEELEVVDSTKTKKPRASKKEVKPESSSDEGKSQVLKSIKRNLSAETLSLLPKRVKQLQSKVPDSGYLIDQSAGEIIKELLNEEKLDTDGTAIEINPGPGVLTENLLQLGFKHLTCFEENPGLAQHLQTNFGPKVKIIENRFLFLSDLQYRDKFSGESRVENLIREIKASPTSNKLYFFGVTPSLKTLIFFILSLASHSIFYDPAFGWEPPTLYFIVSPRCYAVLTAPPKERFYCYRTFSVLSQSFFKVTLLKELDRRVFVPLETYDRNAQGDIRGKWCFLNPDIAYFIRVELNQEVLAKFEPEHLLSYLFFIKSNLFRRNNSVLGSLERLVPNCGPKLIRGGLNFYTKFGDLSPTELVDLYLQFMSWPESQDSAFTDAYDKFCQKVYFPQFGDGPVDKSELLEQKRNIALLKHQEELEF